MRVDGYQRYFTIFFRSLSCKKYNEKSIEISLERNIKVQICWKLYADLNYQKAYKYSKPHTLIPTHTRCGVWKFPFKKRVVFNKWRREKRYIFWIEKTEEILGNYLIKFLWFLLAVYTLLLLRFLSLIRDLCTVKYIYSTVQEW